MGTRRILVTGSRNWMNRIKVYSELVRYVSENTELLVDSQGYPVTWDTDGWVVVHGACPTGADYWAEQWAFSNLVQHEPHPPQWREHGQSAGYVRNAEMVDLGADICLAFINPCQRKNCNNPLPHGSHGATHTADLAEASGIETRRFHS